MNILLIYYHPVIFDFAETLVKLRYDVTIAVNPRIKDNYGTGADVISRVKSNSFLKEVDCIPLPLALQQIKTKEFELVGCDGVFDGDSLIMDACKQVGVPYFCINGYPHNADEPSKNILSFSWFLPQIRYKQKYPSEGHVKEIDWKNIAEQKSDSQNICVFYPEMNYAKRFAEGLDCTCCGEEVNLVSFIHRFEECNKWSYEIFKRVAQIIPTENFSQLSQEEVLKKMAHSSGLLHLKHGDCPGISLLEALILGVPVITMESFIKASFNQELLIDGFNAMIAEDLSDLFDIVSVLKTDNYWPIVPQPHAQDYIWMLTDSDRQSSRLGRFFEKCLK